MMGDFDCALEMELQKYRILDQEDKIMKEIEEYGKEAGNGKRNNEYKFDCSDDEEGSIEEYFNEQMFQSKWVSFKWSLSVSLVDRFVKIRKFINNLCIDLRVKTIK